MSNFKHPGYVYILVNESLPGTVKIGYTSRAVQERINELSDTGMPSPYMKYAAEFVEDAPAVEEAIHVALFANRINMDREFFKIHPDSAVKHLDFETMKYRDNLQETLMKKKTGYSSYLTKDYDNKKFGEFVNLIINNKGKKPISFKELTKKLKIKDSTLQSLIYVSENQPMKFLYCLGFKGKHTSDLKYNLYLKFGQNQLNELIKKYPKIDFVKTIEDKKPAKKWIKKEVNTENKISQENNGDIQLTKDEAGTLYDLVSVLVKHNIAHLKSKRLNKTDKEHKITKRFFSLEELSKMTNRKSEIIEQTFQKCSLDPVLQKFIYLYEKNNKYCLHGDFGKQIFDQAHNEQKMLLEYKNQSHTTLPKSKPVDGKRKNRITP